MTTLPSEPGTSSARVEPVSSYDAVAAAFDQWSRRLSTPFAERVLTLSRLRSGEQLLDVGTGTGLVALLAARHVAPGGRVVGVDVSGGMLALAARKASSLGGAVTFCRTDAHALGVQSASFDAVISLFALRHCAEPRTALSEMRRVLRPGGRLVVAVGNPPSLFSRDGLVRALQRPLASLRRLAGLELQAPGALDALVRAAMPAQQRDHALHTSHASVGLAGLIHEAGFRELRSCWEGHEAVIATPEEFWDLQRTVSSFARERLAGASAEQLEAVRGALLASSRRVLDRGGRLVFRHAALFVSARRLPEGRG